MNDAENYPHIETDEHGVVTDTLIESILNLIYLGMYDEDGFDEMYTKVVQRYINADCPHLMAAHACKDRLNLGAVHYLVMLRLDFQVINRGGPQWPNGEFDGMDGALVAVSISYPDGETWSDWSPGMNLNQASAGALMQYARELSYMQYNQHRLDLDEPSGGGYAN